MSRSSLSHGRRVVLATASTGLPALVLCGVLASTSLSPLVEGVSLFIVGAWWLGGSLIAHRAVVGPLNTLANLLSGVRHGDYSMRSALARPDDPLGVVMLETNALVETLRTQRLGALEATALLRKVMGEIDVAIFAFDEHRRLRLVNRAGEELLGRPRERLEDCEAASLGLDEFLEGPTPRIVEFDFRGKRGRGEIRRSSFRQGGRPHVLMVVADLSRALRQEELTAWRRLVRVLSHEINNSLTPIASAAGSLRRLLDPARRDEDWEDDLQGGLELIESRAKALARFMRSYAKLARLPRPKLVEVELRPLIERVAGLQTGGLVEIQPGPDVSLRADPDQLEQALINLVTNAVDAITGEEGGTQVTMTWSTQGSNVVLSILDDGPGLADTKNLFVPFFSTKPGGSGIGLALSRQIAESHGGTLNLLNRENERGCEARLELPLER